MVTIRKEWKEFYRSSLLFLVLGLIIFSSAFIFFQFKGMPVAVSFRSGLVPVFQTSLYFLPLLSLAYGALSLNDEKGNRTLPILLARGMTIEQFVWKKFISLFAVFLPIVAGGYFLAMIPARFVFDKIAVSELIIFLLAMLMLSMVFLSLGMLLGAWVNQRLRLVGGVIGIWLVLIYLVDLLLMYLLPMVSMDYVFGFSLLYFLSPVNAIQYFLLTQLNIYQLSDLSAYYEQITFQMPWLVVILNVLFWTVISIWGVIKGLRKKGMSLD